MEPTPKIVEEHPKPVEQIPVRVAPSSYQLPAENFDYNDEEYVYYDEWIPIDASNEIQHNWNFLIIYSQHTKNLYGI